MSDIENGKQEAQEAIDKARETAEKAADSAAKTVQNTANDVTASARETVNTAADKVRSEYRRNPGKVIAIAGGIVLVVIAIAVASRRR